MSMRSVILASLLLATLSPAAAEDQPPATPAQPSEPQWAEFQSPEHGFAVEFPGTPKLTSTPVEGQNPLLQYDFQVSVGDDTVYSVVVFEAISDGDNGKGRINHLVDVVPSGDRIYMLVSAGPKGHATDDDAEHFRDSFRLLGDQPDQPDAQSAENPSAQ
jgi:hypothetical protein